MRRTGQRPGERAVLHLLDQLAPQQAGDDRDCQGVEERRGQVDEIRGDLYVQDGERTLAHEA